MLGLQVHGLVTRTSTSVLGRAVGSLVACNNAGHALTCHSNSDSLVLAANRHCPSASRASLGQQAKQRRPTLLHMGTRGSVDFSSALSGPPPVWILSDQALFLRGLTSSDRWGDCVAATRVSNASYHLAVIASSALLDSKLSEQSSSIGQDRFFPTAFGRTPNHTLFGL